MIIRLNAEDLENAFREYNRDYYSPEAYEYILDYYDEIDPDMELDVIAIASSITEYDGIDELKAEYSHMWEEEILDAKSEYAAYNDIDVDDVKESDLDMDKIEEIFKTIFIEGYNFIELSNGHFLELE